MRRYHVIGVVSYPDKVYSRDLTLGIESDKPQPFDIQKVLACFLSVPGRFDAPCHWVISHLERIDDSEETDC